MKKQFGLSWLVAKRELIDQMRDWRILVPMIVLTIFFPYLMNVAARTAADYINRYGGGQLIAERMLPFLMLVVGYFPVTVSLVVALEAFVGEKERGTLEPLLTSPLADWHLYVGKLIAGTLVPLTVSYLGITLYMIGLWRQNIGWPEWSFTVQTLALTAVQTVLMVSAAIVISTQSTTVRAANLLASFIVIPVALLIQGESALMFWGTNQVLWLAVLGVGVMCGLIVRLGLVHFKRENLLGREIDMLNVNWVLETFWRAFSGSDSSSGLGRFLRGWVKRLRKAEVPEDETLTLGQALWLDLQRLGEWYRREIPATLRKMSVSFWLTLVIGVLAVLISYFYVDARITSAQLDKEQITGAMKAIRGMLNEGMTAPTLFVHNLQAELIISGLGIFSFGVLGMLIYVGNLSLIGGVLGVTKMVGLSPLMVFLAGILPHGIFELPSIILASSAVLYMGVRLVTPVKGRSIGESFIISVADVLKVILAVCLPLLLVAALVEAKITPLILLKVIGTVFQAQP